MMQARSSRVSASALCSAAATSAGQSATSLSRSYKVTSDCWPMRNGSNPITVLHSDDCTTAGNSVRASFGVETNTALAHAFSNMRSEEHTSELQSLMRISYAVFCLKKKNKKQTHQHQQYETSSK